MLTLLKGSYTLMLPFFTRTNWHSDARGYGLLLSAIGMGTLVGMFGLSVLRDLHHKTGVVLGMCLLIGFSLIAVAFSSFYLLGLTMLFLTGLAYAVANA